MAFNPQLLEIIACPTCKGKLEYDKEAQQLICHFDKVAYPIESDIPVLLENRAIPLSQQDQVAEVVETTAE